MRQNWRPPDGPTWWWAASKCLNFLCNLLIKWFLWWEREVIRFSKTGRCVMNSPAAIITSDYNLGQPQAAVRIAMATKILKWWNPKKRVSKAVKGLGVEKMCLYYRLRWSMAVWSTTDAGSVYLMSFNKSRRMEVEWGCQRDKCNHKVDTRAREGRRWQF